MITYTKGPWNTCRLAPDSDPEERHIITAENGEVEICGIVGSLADACLIAAVPDLLVAAKGLFADAEDRGETHDEHGNEYDDWKQLKAAIEKAEGSPA